MVFGSKSRPSLLVRSALWICSLFLTLTLPLCFCGTAAADALQIGEANWLWTGSEWELQLEAPPAGLPETTSAFTVQVSNPSVAQRESYVIPHLEDSVLGELPTWDAETGKPLLPVRPVKLLIPRGHKLLRVLVAPAPAAVVPGTHAAAPAAPFIPSSSAPENNERSPDPAVYGSESPFPSFPMGDPALRTLHGAKIATLNLFPMHYYPAQQRLEYYPQLSVTVVTAPDLDQPLNIRSRRKLPAHAEADLLDFVDNSHTVESYQQSSSLRDTIMDSPAAQYDYIIITSTTFADEFAPLIASKTARGISAAVFTIEDDVYPHYSGTENGDNADKIRHFIRNAYDTMGTRWVLLAGDIEVIPARGVYLTNGKYTESDAASDNYYACLDGPWNYDGDSYWGEYNDGAGGSDVDMLAEVYVGRAAVSSELEASRFVAKAVQYETTDHTNAKSALMLSENLDDSPTWGSYSIIPMEQSTIPADWTVTQRYDSVASWSGSTLVNDLNAGPHLVNHLGHANYTYNAKITTSSVRNLSNSQPYFMYSQGCQSGGFDKRDLSIAEQHIVSEHGAFAVIMNARYGWYSPGSYPGASHYYAVDFWEALSNENKARLGTANQDSKDDNLFRVGSTGVYRWIHMELNLLGDPESPIQELHKPAAEGVIEGDVIKDINGNGAADIGEALLSGQDVYLDINGNSSRDSTSISPVSADTPIAIENYRTISSEIAVSGASGVVTDVNVLVDITHQADRQVGLVLVSPSGTRIKLLEGVGSYGDNFTNTLLDDEAASSITSGSPPFTGSFRPMFPLSRLDGEAANGTWTLNVTDDDKFNTGSLASWTLQLTYGDPTVQTDAGGNYRFEGVSNGSYSVRHDASAGWSWSNPADGSHSVAISAGQPESANNDFFAVPPGDDQDGDGTSDSYDCAVSDETKWRNQAYSDSDKDGIRNSAVLLTTDCFGDTPPAGYTLNETALDNCAGDANPDQADTDSDGQGDSCDDDQDNDGVDNYNDCARFDDNRWRNTAYRDSDGDGIRDYITLVYTPCFGSTPPSGYSLAANGPDNCRAIANPDQLDSDRDGIGNACEGGGYTPPDGGGSPDESDPTPRLGLPATGVWNGFNRHTNVVECSNLGDTEQTITIKVTNYLSEVIGEREISVPAKGTKHVLLNDFGVTDSYGTYSVDIEGLDSDYVPLRCSTLFYRNSSNPSEESPEYAFSVPVQAPLNGTSYGLFNSMNPETRNPLPVFNWLSVYNPGDAPFSADVEVFNGDGSRNSEWSFRVSNLRPGDRIDRPLGHPAGWAVGMYRVVPDNSEQDYGAFVSRYSRGSASDAYRFGFMLLADTGFCDSGPVAASTMGPAINWGEITNVTDENVWIDVHVYSRDRELLHSETRKLKALSQYHVFLNEHIGEQNVGYFRVQCSDPFAVGGKLLVQSLYYGYSAADPQSVTWAYGSQANGVPLEGRLQALPINTYFGAVNWLKIFNVGTTREYVHLKVYTPEGDEVVTDYDRKRLEGSLDIPLHEEVGTDFTGLVTVQTDAAVTVELLRVFPDQPSGGSGGIGTICNINK